MDDPRARYRGYDVLAKRDTPSWNDADRRVIGERLATDPDRQGVLDAAEWATLKAVCDRVVPQPRPHRIPVAALVARKLERNEGDGYRHEGMPPLVEAWRRGLAALDEEARLGSGAEAFHVLPQDQQDALLAQVQRGEVHSPAWQRVPAKLFFKDRLLKDIVRAYYSHPIAWNEIGFGGPASIRGYVRTGLDERDPWEAEEHKDPPGRR